MIPAAISFETLGPQVLAALERRHASRRAEDGPRRIPALVLARRFGIRVGSSDDSRKKGVRNLIRHLRGQGAPICSDLAGYYLGGSAAEWEEYMEFRRRSGLIHLAAAAAVDRSDAHVDSMGQLSLFNKTSKTVRRGLPDAPLP